MLWSNLLTFALALARSTASVASAEADEDDGTGLALSAAQLSGLHGKIDVDGDAKVSLEELLLHARVASRSIAQQDVRSLFDELDLDHDGKLSLEEHLGDLEKQVEGADHEELLDFERRKEVELAKFQAADDDGDGLLSLEEGPALFYPELHDKVLEVAVRDFMQVKDRSRDGRLSLLEFWDIEEVDAGDPGLSQVEMADFHRLDRDSDGYLDAGELHPWQSGRFHTEAALRGLLEAADTDPRDGYLTLEELVQARGTLSTSDAHYHFIEWAEHWEL